MTALLYTPEHMLAPEAADYPAHLHIDLLPEYQGRGFGRILLTTLFAALDKAGAARVHLVMGTANTAARAFYDRMGFHEIPVADTSIDIPGALHQLSPADRFKDPSSWIMSWDLHVRPRISKTLLGSEVWTGPRVVSNTQFQAGVSLLTSRHPDILTS